MTANEFSDAGRSLFGRHGWKIQAAEAMGLHRNTVSKYADGTLDVPLKVQLHLSLLLESKKEKGHV